MDQRALAVIAALAIAGFTSLSPAAASNQDCPKHVSLGVNAVSLIVRCSTAGLQGNPAGSTQQSSNQSAASPSGPPPRYSATRWVAPCGNFLDEYGLGGAAGSCLGAIPDWCQTGEIPVLLQGLQANQWVSIGHRCLPPPDTTETTTATITALTPELIAEAFQRLPLPPPAMMIQPAAETLVNLDTYFHVTAEPFRTTVNLLGQTVELNVHPSHFTWTFGDGTQRTTTHPGAPYPQGTITHRYRTAHTTAHPQLTITWTGTWRTPHTTWTPIPGTATTTSPPTPLHITEATPTLTSPHPHS